jgi:S-adenosylmethionine-diacylglycerol 3-amino-3-carboxypropyl transferase
MNPRQNALLELKKSVFQEGSHDDLFQMFGEGVHHQVNWFYQDTLRPILPDFTKLE